MTDTTPQAPKGRLPRVKTCSGLQPYGLGEAGCKRLPRHKGEHRGTLHAVTVAKPPVAPKGRKVRFSVEREAVGRRWSVYDAVRGEPVATGLTKGQAEAEAKLLAELVTPVAAPKVRKVRAAVVRRQVAAPTKSAKRTRFVTSGSPKVARPAVG